MAGRRESDARTMNWVDNSQLAVIAGYAIVTTAKLGLVIRRRVHPVAIGVGKKGVARYIELALPIAMGFWAWLVVRYALHLNIGFLPPAFHTVILREPLLRDAGVLLLIISTGLLAAALIQIGDSYRLGVADPGRLVTRGVFRWSRNPVFLSFDLLIIGAFLANGTVALLALAALALLGFDFQIRKEEAFLRGRFRGAYEDYAARTPRYLGWWAGAVDSTNITHRICNR